MDTTITYQAKKLIVEEIRMKPSYHQRIYILMASCNVPMTSNSNGIFFDMECVPDDVFLMIKDILKA